MILIIAIIIGAIALDQLTKWLTVTCLEYHETVPLWQDVFHFTHERNEGAAFGILSDHRWVFMVVSSVAIVALLIYLIRFMPKSKIVRISLAMIAGGGIGNMIDRVYLGYVIDFIDVRLINFAVFNIADSFVTVGAFLFMGYMIYDTVLEYKREKNAKAKKAEQEESLEEPASDIQEESAQDDAEEH